MNRQTLPSSPPRPGSEPPRDAALELEWLETDGRGGYASSTPSLCPTRRYHGLLVAPLEGSVGRYVFLSRFDELLREPDGDAHFLSVARYPGQLAPRGDLALASFEHEPQPTAVYQAGAARVRREVRLLRGRHAVLVRYALEKSNGPRRLELRPLLPYREADGLTMENADADPSFVAIPGGVSCRPYAGLPPLALTASEPVELAAEAVWYRDLVFEADRARGYSGREDEPSPGVLAFTLDPGSDVIVAATTGAPVDDPRGEWEREGKRRRRPRRAADPLAARFERAADDFLYVGPGGRPGVIAGFPWFLEWGRDTFLALPGLTLARGKLDECAAVLRGALPFLQGGLLPNVFGAGVEDSHYDSADAALWFARAVLLYQRAGGDEALVREELRPALESIAEAYVEGARLGLHVDEAGMLHAGAPDLNPTWMDARTPAGPATPRHGSPVEIAALWCSLLAQLEELAASGTAERLWGDRRRAAARAFVERFWVPERGMLADVWRDGEQDLSVRPNMVLAAALELAPLNKTQRRAIVRVAEERLLTPRGLRTLAPSDPAYVGRYGGGPEERDAAYHQGTVWPWLVGAYVEAALRAAAPRERKARVAVLGALLDGFAPELDRAGIGHVSEVFDGDADEEGERAPGGTIAQAWNTAEWLRARRMLAGALA